MFLFRRSRTGIIKRPNQDKAVQDKSVIDNPVIRKSVKGNSIKDNSVIKDNSIRDMAVNAKHEETSFASHISKYIGKTVTVFVDAGGPAGLGFTGILSDVDSNSLKLVVNAGPPPACPLKNMSCIKYNGPFYGFLNLYYGPYINTKHHYFFHAPQDGINMPYAGKPLTHTGSAAYILTSSVTAFVHNLN